MAEVNKGKITQVIGAVLDIRFDAGHLPEINEAIKVPPFKYGCCIPVVLFKMEETVSYMQVK